MSMLGWYKWLSQNQAAGSLGPVTVSHPGPGPTPWATDWAAVPCPSTFLSNHIGTEQRGSKEAAGVPRERAEERTKQQLQGPFPIKPVPGSGLAL